MALGKIVTFVGAGILAASGVMAKDKQNGCNELNSNSQSPYTIQTGDTLECIADNTGSTVSIIMNDNPYISERFGVTFPNPINNSGEFGSAPEHTIFPGDSIDLDGNSITGLGDISDSLSAAGVDESRFGEIKSTIEQGLIAIPGITVENATQIAIALERIPKDRAIAILMDNSGSTNNDRELISKFVRFFISDWEQRKELVSQEGDTNTVRTYAYSTIPVEVTGNENEYVNTGDGGTENNVYAIQEAFNDGAQHVIVITDEPGDDNQRQSIDGHSENTTIFMIDDFGQSGNQFSGNIYEGIEDHGTLYKLEAQGGE